MIIAFANLKGGVGKTTSAVMVAAALHREHGSTLLIDADAQGSALSWNEKADLPFPVVSLPSKTLHREISKSHAFHYENIVIDTPPGSVAITGSALHAADHVVIPMQPTTADLDQLAETIQLIEEIQDIRGGGGLPRLHILLTRVIKRTRSQEETFELLEAENLPCLEVPIYQRQALAVAHGNKIDELHGYDEVLAHIEKTHLTPLRQTPFEDQL